MARDGSFSCRASAAHLPLLGDPIVAGDNLATANDKTDASDPCKPEASPTPAYGGPTGCYRFLDPSAPTPTNPTTDPNCTNPNTVSLGLLWAETKECRPNYADPTVEDLCSSTNGHVDLQGKNSAPLDGDGVKAGAGAANLFLTDGGGNYLHASAINSFAEVTCRPDAAGTLVPNWDSRSQVVFVNLAGMLGLDLLPGLIPNASPTQPDLNKFGEAGPFRFNATYANDNEPGGKVGPTEGRPQPVDPVTGAVNYTDADAFTPGNQTVTKITQIAVDLAGGVVQGGIASVDVTKNPCGPGINGGKGTIVVNKVTNNKKGADLTAFGFELDPGDQKFNLANGQTATFPNLVAGSYTVTEDENDRYDQSVACTDPSGNTTTAGRTATIALAANETVTCTYTNTKKFGHKPPKCDKDHNGKDDHDGDGDGYDDRDYDGDGKDDRDGKDVNRHDNDHDGDDDECDDKKKKGKKGDKDKDKCSKHAKKSKKASSKDDDKGKGKHKGDKDDDKGKDKDKGDKDKKKSCKSKKSKKAKKGSKKH